MRLPPARCERRVARAEGLEVRPEAWVRVTTASARRLLGSNLHPKVGNVRSCPSLVLSAKVLG